MARALSALLGCTLVSGLLLPSGTQGRVRRWASTRAVNSGTTIVETNQIRAFGGSAAAVVCETADCAPLRRALDNQQSALLPPRLRGLLARTQLAYSNWLLKELDASGARAAIKSKRKATEKTVAATKELLALLDARGATGRTADAVRFAKRFFVGPPSGSKAASARMPQEAAEETLAEATALLAVLDVRGTRAALATPSARAKQEATRKTLASAEALLASLDASSAGSYNAQAQRRAADEALGSAKTLFALLDAGGATAARPVPEAAEATTLDDTEPVAELAAAAGEALLTSLFGESKAAREERERAEARARAPGA